MFCLARSCSCETGEALTGATINRKQGACKVAELRKLEDKLFSEYEANS